MQLLSKKYIFPFPALDLAKPKQRKNVYKLQPNDDSNWMKKTCPTTNSHTNAREIAVKKEEQTNVIFPKINRRSNNIGRSPCWIEILIHVVIVFSLLLLLMVCGPTEREKNPSIFRGAVDVVVAKSNCFDHFSFVFMMEICQPFSLSLPLCVWIHVNWIYIVCLLACFSLVLKVHQMAMKNRKSCFFSLSLHFLYYIGYLLTHKKQASTARVFKQRLIASPSIFSICLLFRFVFGFVLRFSFFRSLFLLVFHWMAIYLPFGTFCCCCCWLFLYRNWR